MKKITIKEIAQIGIMSAAVYVASAFLQVPIPTAIDNTRLHMGECHVPAGRYAFRASAGRACGGDWLHVL